MRMGYIRRSSVYPRAWLCLWFTAKERSLILTRGKRVCADKCWLIPERFPEYFLGLIFKYLICIFSQSHLAFRLNFLSFGDISTSVLATLTDWEVNRLANCFFLYSSRKLRAQVWSKHKHQTVTSYITLYCLHYRVPPHSLHAVWWVCTPGFINQPRASCATI